MPVHVINEANRCLQCKNPRCRMLGCPIQTNIPEVVRLFKENRMMEAAEILFENNPLSVVCSLVCNHENQCEGHCVRGIKGEPVHFSSIENYISDSCFERLDLSCAPSNGMGRKYDKRIFPEGMDCRYLYGTVKAVTHKDILCASRSRNKSNPGQTGQWACVCPVTA